MTLDVRTLEVLISRICHDLISPISAVNNGTELVAELGSANAEDAFDLIRQSAAAASVKLQAFRLAYGAGGSEWHVSLGDVEKSFGDVIALEPRYKIEWNVQSASLPQPMPRGLPKLAMLCLIWAQESLPKGGLISVSAVRDSDERFSLIIEARGDNASLREGTEDAFSGTTPPDMLTPKTVHAAATGHYAKAYGITVAPGMSASECVQFRLTART